MKRRAPAIGREALAVEIAGLSKLDIDELRERWKAMFGKAPSRDISRSFLTRAIAYRLQEKAFEVAREITGTRWSGPLFFGLKRSQEESRDGAR